MAANVGNLFCHTCGSQVELYHRFCVQCGCQLNSEEMFIRHYFFKGYDYQTITAFLAKYHEVHLSLRTLKRRISSYGLKRKNANSDVQAVRRRIQQKLDGSGCLVGYRSMWHTLRMEGYMVPRVVVQTLLKEMDPEGCKQRRAKRLKRRIYSVPGPNFCWHIDGYDKLKPYGFAIHGCIDGWSRKVLWLKLLRSNNDPNIIGNIFVNTVQDLGGCPQKLRSDCGSENGLAAAAQCYFRNSASAHIYGTSPSNQRIESWWSHLRKNGTTWWINFFKDLIDQETFNPANQLQLECLWFCFADVLQHELDDMCEHWNTHYIRPSRHETIAGRPNELYFLLELSSSQDFMEPVTDAQCSYVTGTFIGQSDESNIYQDYFDYAARSLALDLPSSWHESLNLYETLLQYA